MDAALIAACDGYSSFAWPTPVVPPPLLAGVDQPPFPANKLGIRVLLAFGADVSGDPAGWIWTDVSRYVQYKERIVIGRGGPDEQGEAQPATCAFRLRNPDGIFSPRNAVGPWYGQFRLNTPCRVEVNPGSGWHTRFTGFVSRWNPRRDITGNHRWISVVASGKLRQLTQGAQPLRSPLYRAITASSPAPVAYWPLEEGKLVSAPTNAVQGGVAMVASSASVFARAGTGIVSGSVDGPLGSASATDMSGGGQLYGSVSGTSGTSWRIGFAFKYNQPLGSADSGDILLLRTVDANGNRGWWRFSTSTSGANNWVWEWGIEGVSTILDGTSPGLDDGAWHWLEIAAQDGSGTNTTYTVTIDGVLEVSEVNRGSIKAGAIQSALIADSGDLSAANHLVVWPTNAALSIDTYDAFLGHTGEEALVRFDRLCDEEGIAADAPTATASRTMGAQGIDTLVALLRECAGAEEIRQVERFDSRMGLDARSLRYNQTPTLTTDWAAHDLVEVPQPSDDDLLTRNDITVTRTNGVSARVVDETGPKGVSGTTGVGRYDEAATLALELDSQAIQNASWRVHRGTVDEQRLPGIKINLARNPELIPGWLAMDLGMRYLVNNVDVTDVGDDTLDQILDGYIEEIDQLMWEVTLVGSPALAYEVWQVQNGTGNRSRIAAPAGGTTLTAAVDEDDIFWNVVSATTRWIDAATYPAMFPFDIWVDGERCTVEDISNAGLSQLFVCIRSVNGVVKRHEIGAEIQLYRPAVVAL